MLMFQQKYNVCMVTAVGPRYGTMVVQINHNKISGQLEFFQHSGEFSGIFYARGQCRIAGTLAKNIINDVWYVATGKITEHSLNLILQCENQLYDMRGEKCVLEV